MGYFTWFCLFVILSPLVFFFCIFTKLYKHVQPHSVLTTLSLVLNSWHVHKRQTDTNAPLLKLWAITLLLSIFLFLVNFRSLFQKLQQILQNVFTWICNRQTPALSILAEQQLWQMVWTIAAWISWWLLELQQSSWSLSFLTPKTISWSWISPTGNIYPWCQCLCSIKRLIVAQHISHEVRLTITVFSARLKR